MPLLLTFLLSCSCLSAPTLSPDRVTRVVDGDTVILQQLGRARLIGVDTPESVKPDHPVERFGPEAYEFLRNLIEGRSVLIDRDAEKMDDHNRVLVYLYLSPDRLINLEIIESGYGYAFTIFPFRETQRFLQAEDEARAEGRGLWSAIPEEERNHPLHGNVRSRFYHSSNCEHYRCTNCAAEYSSRAEAEEGGYRPHWNCVGKR